MWKKMRHRPVIDQTKMRIHVASFDASEGGNYNRENCEIAAGLFKSQPERDSAVLMRKWSLPT